MATITLTTLLARARTISTQMATDANASPLIDDLAGLRALLNHCIQEVYRRKATDQKFLRDITARNTIVLASGSGTLPDTIMREFLHQCDATDENNSLVNYLNYAADYNSGVNFDQLGYFYILGDLVKYTAPAPTFATYNGDFYITSPTMPAAATSMTFPTDETVNDIVLLLATAIRGEVAFSDIDMKQAA